jgi:2-keto-4-pentenoate hydratase/2-oxohepta-3-ene-1,7-dioic acid hydratase in catechol pathway
VLTPDGAIWGVVDGEELRRLADGPFADLDPVEVLGRLEEFALLAPVAPTKIVCVGRNYAAHAAEHGAALPAAPLLFLKPPSAVIGPGSEIVLPAASLQVEHESELALVIGRRCRVVPEDRAWATVLGVTCGNDVTARDLQRADAQWTRAKGFDTFCPLGPWVVTDLDEAAVADIEVRCTVNSELRQRGNTAQMAFKPAFLISYISKVMTLEAGDVIMTGTPDGVGPLQTGDQVTVEIDGIGVLTNPVV